MCENILTTQVFPETTVERYSQHFMPPFTPNTYCTMWQRLGHGNHCYPYLIIGLDCSLSPYQQTSKFQTRLGTRSVENRNHERPSFSVVLPIAATKCQNKFYNTQTEVMYMSMTLLSYILVVFCCPLVQGGKIPCQHFLGISHHSPHTSSTDPTILHQLNSLKLEWKGKMAKALQTVKSTDYNYY